MRPGAAEVKTLGPAGYSRLEGRVLVRRVTRATRANLDYAAYHANVMIRQSPQPAIAPGQAKVPVGEDLPTGQQLFGGALLRESIVTTAAGTPLSARELSRPLAFVPLTDALARWDADKASCLEAARSAVRSESWGLPRRPGTYLQQITEIYIHRPPGGGAQLWVRIEFEPWARLFTEMPDEDGDGVAEIYGRLSPRPAHPALVQRVERVYAARLLTTAQVHAWANELASYWYPSYNTDVVKLPPQASWPIPGLERAVREANGDLRVQRPTVVIRGKPEGQAIYLVLVVDGAEPLVGRRAAPTTQPATRPSRHPLTSEHQRVQRALEQELAAHGGSWAAWDGRVARWQQGIRTWLGRRPSGLKALVGEDGFLFYRRSLDYVVGGDVQAQPAAKNPLPAIVEFQQYLARKGIDFLLVPVPTKAEVFPDKLPGLRMPRGAPPMIHPRGRKFLLELSRAGVEVIDLLPGYLQARTKRARRYEPLYQPQDTHWTDRGLRLAAAAIAARIERYPWWPELARSKTAYTIKPTTFTRQGDLVSRLAESEQRLYRPARLRAQQVLTPAGKPYEDDAASPVVLLGDSFTGVYERTDCGAAGVSAHVAHRLQHPVDLVMSYGGGPNVRNKLLRRDAATLNKMRLVIWLFAARDFFNYWDDWAKLQPAGGSGQ